MHTPKQHASAWQLRPAIAGRVWRQATCRQCSECWRAGRRWIAAFIGKLDRGQFSCRIARNGVEARANENNRYQAAKAWVLLSKWESFVVLARLFSSSRSQTLAAFLRLASAPFVLHTIAGANLGGLEEQGSGRAKDRSRCNPYNPRAGVNAAAQGVTKVSWQHSCFQALNLFHP